MLLFFSVLISVGLSNMVDISEIRESYRYAKKSAENTEKFYQLTSKSDYSKNHIIAAYHGCALTLKAAFSSSIGNKISFFKQGKKLIEASIEKDPDNIELRMVRLSVQTSAPGITGYKKNIEEDKTFIINHIESISSISLKKFVKGFIRTSEAFEE